MIMVNFGLKIFKLGLIIMNICYFLGLFWYIFCDLGRDSLEYHIETLTEE